MQYPLQVCFGLGLAQDLILGVLVGGTCQVHAAAAGITGEEAHNRFSIWRQNKKCTTPLLTGWLTSWMADFVEDVPVLAENQGLMFVSKPSGMSTHPMRNTRKRVKEDGELLCPACGRNFGKDEGAQWVALHNHVNDCQDEQHVQWRDQHGEHRAQMEEERTLWHSLLQVRAKVHLCNRLDRGTSGIVCVAETADLANQLREIWPSVKKQYVALVRGKTEQRFVVDKMLTDRDSTLQPQPQRTAVTGFELIRTFFDGNLSLLRVELIEGGRKHQIRRHLNSVAHQIIGDRQYGKSKINNWLQEDFGLNRLFLHAESLELLHPITQEQIKIHDPLPSELQDFLGRLPP